MITYTEAGQLLALAAARDQRTVGDTDVLAWHADLNTAHLDYATAVEALTRFYQEMAARKPEDRFRATAVDLIDIARRTRHERLANFTYEPPAGDSDPNYLKRLRGQIAATADGHTPPPQNRPAITPGHGERMKQLLAGIGRPVGNEDEDAEPDDAVAAVRRPGPLGRTCPNCRAPIGRSCRTPGGKTRGPHTARTHNATDPATEAAEIERRRAVSARRLAELEETP